MVRIAWRLQRTGLIGMTGFGAVYGLIQAAAYVRAAGSTAASRIAFGHEMETFGRTFTVLLPLPVRLDTPPGYVQWRVYGGLVLLFAAWALMSAVGASRADEDRGLVEGWLASGVGRGRYLGTRLGVFAMSAVIAVAVTSAVTDAVLARSGFPLDAGAVVAESVVLIALTLACYALVLLVAQLVNSRATATGLASAVLAAVFLVNGFGRTDEHLGPVARLVSPFYYADRSTPLTPGGSLDVGATAGLIAGALALTALAAWLMQVRDIGAPLVRLPRRVHAATHLPARNPLLRIPALSMLYEQRLPLLGWALGSTVAAAYIGLVGRRLVDLAKEPGSFHTYLTLAGHGNPYVALTGYFWFGIFQLVLVAFALVGVAGWASDDTNGRLEMVLSAPVSRWQVVGERAVSFLAEAVAIIALSSAAFYLSATLDNIGLHPRDLVVASLLLIPFVLSFAALGAVLTGWVPRAALAGLATVAFVSYLITEGGPLFRWPDWVMRLSVFSLYGTPLVSGIYWAGLWILVGVTLGGFGVAGMLMQRREVGR